MKRLSHAEIQCLVAFASFLFLGAVGTAAPTPGVDGYAASQAQVFIGTEPQAATIEPSAPTF